MATVSVELDELELELELEELLELLELDDLLELLEPDDLLELLELDEPLELVGVEELEDPEEELERYRLGSGMPAQGATSLLIRAVNERAMVAWSMILRPCSAKRICESMAT